jgi:hypothetical protein
MPLVDVIHDDGRRTRMTPRALAKAQGWREANPEQSVDPDGHTIAEVLEAVGDDPVKAEAALEAERQGKNRSTLTQKLADVADVATEED